MTKNTMIDLNNHLFEQLERLNDEELTTEVLEKEIKRGKAMTELANAIINNANTVIKAAVAFGTEDKLPEILSIDN